MASQRHYRINKTLNMILCNAHYSKVKWSLGTLCIDLTLDWVPVDICPWWIQKSVREMKLPLWFCNMAIQRNLREHCENVVLYCTDMSTMCPGTMNNACSTCKLLIAHCNPATHATVKKHVCRVRCRAGITQQSINSTTRQNLRQIAISFELILGFENEKICGMS